MAWLRTVLQSWAHKPSIGTTRPQPRERSRSLSLGPPESQAFSIAHIHSNMLAPDRNCSKHGAQRVKEQTELLTERCGEQVFAT